MRRPSVTLKHVSKGLEPLHKYIGWHTREYRRYHHGLSKFVFWWNDHVVVHKSAFVGSTLKYRHKDVLCTGILISHSMFVCLLYIKPIDETVDIGEGAGVAKKITFHCFGN